jgi:mannose-1-phosphate guanylyltransferase
VYITTGYLGNLIQGVCGDGSQWDVRIRYTDETEPLGTVGALSLLREELDGTFLVINGDILTDLNIGAFVAAHRANASSLTIATARRTVRMDFGIIEDRDGRVVHFMEKPTLTQNVSMGVYCMEPELLKHIPKGAPFGFDDLMACMLGRGLPVHIFPHNDVWLDIGRIEDFQKAQDLDVAMEQMPPAFQTAPVLSVASVAAFSSAEAA